MNLQETIAAFLVANPDATADEVHVHVTGLEVSEIIKTNTQEAKTGIATVDLLNNTLDRLEVYVAPPELDPALHEAAEDVARKLTRTFNMLFSPEFYINLNVTEVKGAFDAALFLGVLTQVEYDGIMAAVTATSKPFATTTIEQVKAVISPVSWQAVDIASGNTQVVMPEGNSLISASNRGGFRFTLTPAEDFKGQVKIRIKAKKADDTLFGLFSQFTIVFNESFVANQPIIQMFQRVAGLSGFRHFIFEYDAPYAGAITNVVVDSVTE